MAEEIGLRLYVLGEVVNRNQTECYRRGRSVDLSVKVNLAAGLNTLARTQPGPGCGTPLRSYGICMCLLNRQSQTLDRVPAYAVEQVKQALDDRLTMALCEVENLKDGIALFRGMGGRSIIQVCLQFSIHRQRSGAPFEGQRGKGNRAELGFSSLLIRLNQYAGHRIVYKRVAVITSACT